MAATPHDPLHGLTILERGWLSSNNVLVHAAAGDAGALLIDSSHVDHAGQTVALLDHALAGRPLAAIVNTHLHSDHCGGNASLQRAFGATVAVPPGQADAVRRWDDDALSYRFTGQRVEPFAPERLLEPGQPLRAGGRQFEVIAAPGHDPHAVMLFDRAAGVLVSADALWHNGFGLVFPEVVGEPGFDDVEAVLDVIAALPVRVVIPGHGAPFDDVAEALGRARSRLASWRADPARHGHHAAKVIVKYHLMEERVQDTAALLAWAASTPLLAEVWQRFVPRAGGFAQWIEHGLLADLARSGAVMRDGEVWRDG